MALAEIEEKEVKAETFDRGIAVILATFPNMKADEHSLVVWRGLLVDLPDAEFMRSVVEVCRSCEMYPGSNLVAMIRERALPDPGPTSDQAYKEVIETVHSVGKFGLIRFSHKRVGAAVDTIGWSTLCDSFDTARVREQFIKAYDALSKREKEKRLIGDSGAIADQLMKNKVDIQRIGAIQK